ncbi:MAG: antitermination protein NusG, partial [Planctomycetes bacterium]|nr:antitermination protein NusG [Planctomycetota bacterium]
RLKPGMRVRVRSGSLENLEGVVIRREGRERLLVAVAFLQQGASVSIEDVQLERID